MEGVSEEQVGGEVEVVQPRVTGSGTTDILVSPRPAGPVDNNNSCV